MDFGGDGNQELTAFRASLFKKYQDIVAAGKEGTVDVDDLNIT